MIRANIMGNLGNQMFQYAYARALSKRYNEELHLTFYNTNNQLKDFCLKSVYIDKKLKLTINQYVSLTFFILCRKIIANNDRAKQQKLERVFNNWLQKKGIYFNTLGYFPYCKSLYKNKVLIGYFESSKYFSEISEELKNEFVPKHPILEDNKLLYDQIEKTESVAISIRRGDFVKIGNIVCDEKYFKDAINIMKKKLRNPTFFVFSDDINWVKNNMKFPKNTFFEDGKSPVWEKMRMLYSCKHFIISNSTFSWWGAYLSRNENKIVIAPKKWRPFNAEIDILEDNWLKL